MERLLLKPEVVEMTGRSYVTLLRMVKRGEFPRGVIIGRGQAARVAWKQSEVMAWLNKLPRQTFLGEPNHKETLADQIRKEAGSKGGKARARRMKPKRQRLGEG